jgi:hypothetical protein
VKKYGLSLSIALVVIVNSIVFSGVIYNRSGEPDAKVILTQREVPLLSTKKENTGLFLQLKWEMSGSYQFENLKNKKNWLDRKKLGEIGYDFPVNLDNSSHNNYYKRKKFPQKTTFIVLEFDGVSWENWLKDHKIDIHKIEKKLENEDDGNKKENLERTLKLRKRLPLIKSRLFAIDAGNDPGQLRDKYPDSSRYIITSGVIQVNYYPRYYGKIKSAAYVQGRIHSLFPKEIFVSNSFRSFFENVESSPHYSYFYIPEKTSDSDLLPQYEVSLNLGRKYEAWISEVKTLNNKNL